MPEPASTETLLGILRKKVVELLPDPKVKIDVTLLGSNNITKTIKVSNYLNMMDFRKIVKKELKCKGSFDLSIPYYGDERIKQCNEKTMLYEYGIFHTTEVKVHTTPSTTLRRSKRFSSQNNEEEITEEPNGDQDKTEPTIKQKIIEGVIKGEYAMTYKRHAAEVERRRKEQLYNLHSLEVEEEDQDLIELYSTFKSPEPSGHGPLQASRHRNRSSMDGGVDKKVKAEKEEEEHKEQEQQHSFEELDSDEFFEARSTLEIDDTLEQTSGLPVSRADSETHLNSTPPQLNSTPSSNSQKESSEEASEETKNPKDLDYISPTSKKESIDSNELPSQAIYELDSDKTSTQKAASLESNYLEKTEITSSKPISSEIASKIASPEITTSRPLKRRFINLLDDEDESESSSAENEFDELTVLWSLKKPSTQEATPLTKKKRTGVQKETEPDTKSETKSSSSTASESTLKSSEPENIASPTSDQPIYKFYFQNKPTDIFEMKANEPFKTARDRYSRLRSEPLDENKCIVLKIGTNLLFNDQTPSSVEASLKSANEITVIEDQKRIRIRFELNKTKDAVMYNVSHSLPMGTACKRFAKKMNLEFKKLTFVYKKQIVSKKTMPQDLGMVWVEDTPEHRRETIKVIVKA